MYVSYSLKADSAGHSPSSNATQQRRAPSLRLECVSASWAGLSHLYSSLASHNCLETQGQLHSIPHDASDTIEIIAFKAHSRYLQVASIPDCAGHIHRIASVCHVLSSLNHYTISAVPYPAYIFMSIMCRCSSCHEDNSRARSLLILPSVGSGRIYGEQQLDMACLLSLSHTCSCKITAVTFHFCNCKQL